MFVGEIHQSAPCWRKKNPICHHFPHEFSPRLPYLHDVQGPQPQHQLPQWQPFGIVDMGGHLFSRFHSLTLLGEWQIHGKLRTIWENIGKFIYYKYGNIMGNLVLHLWRSIQRGANQEFLLLNHSKLCFITIVQNWWNWAKKNYFFMKTCFLLCCGVWDEVVEQKVPCLLLKVVSKEKQIRLFFLLFLFICLLN